MTAMSLPSVPRLGFIGAGRLARCLARRFAQAGFPVVAIASRSAASAQALAAPIDGCVAVANAQAVVDAADLIFVTVSDDGIGPVAASLRFDPARAPAQALVHCSGASSVELLAPARAQLAQTGGFHPLYLFGGADADLTRIEGCSVTIEADGTLRPVLDALAAALGCHPLAIPSGGRMLYHAAAHYAASFALCGLAEAVALWRQLGMNEADALRALLPMLSGTIETARDKGLANALAGPVSRGDAGIVERQLALLDELGDDHAVLYALMTRRAVGLARRRAVPPAGLDALAGSVDALLASHLARPAPARREP
ncbi:NADP oxidoreductase, coenzyme F420-dependent [Burkholderia plantarii]|uniref:NADP oxidoreductase, coenzyme F420-dependent n=2 Tax=Burkholderia plantarii TaxID=41899 RepID=A0A0B6RPP6_BURPL|nr:NADP oxidoreductase, coenzyme F420-dependent [Burkholderia plantarii]